MEEPLQRFTIQEMFRELREAERKKRTADFSNKLLPEFSFSGREINVNLNFKNSTIQGAAYFDDCQIRGSLNLENTLIYTTLYISKTKIQDDFIARRAKVREVVNLIASNFYKNINLEEINIRGFLGLNKVFIKENVSIKRGTTESFKTKTGTIRGDIYFQKAKIGGDVILENLFVDGLGNFEESNISGDLLLKNTQFQGIVTLSGTIVEGKIDAEGMQCENLIAHMI